MHVVISQNLGRILHATGHPVLQKTRPTYCFVLEEFFDENGFRKEKYLISRWPSINCSANPLGVGSHVIPDTERPFENKFRCPVLREFLRRLETFAAIKAAA